MSELFTWTEEKGNTVENNNTLSDIERDRREYELLERKNMDVRSRIPQTVIVSMEAVVGVAEGKIDLNF